MDSNRIKELQETTAYPDSLSVNQALLRVWNECEQEQRQEERDILLSFAAWLYKVDGVIEIPIYTDIVDEYIARQTARRGINKQYENNISR